MNEIRGFIEWLSYHPTADEISRALVLDHLATLGACCVRIGLFNSDDSVTFVGEYGFEDGRKGKTFPSSEWRTWNFEAVEIAIGRNPDHWSNDKKLLMFQLRHRGAIQGHLAIRFSQSVEDCSRVEQVVMDYAVPISLYLSLNHEGQRGGTSAGRDDTGAEQLTPRQLSILGGMVEGKTNHELATELGFSVSTIRHETMRIYQALAVSDRKEAAKKALALSLV
ncbi:Transcription regulator LuxR, C-terminal [Candidatus Nanopelagicaceae bacterium]